LGIPKIQYDSLDDERRKFRDPSGWMPNVSGKNGRTG